MPACLHPSFRATSPHSAINLFHCYISLKQLHTTVLSNRQHNCYHFPQFLSLHPTKVAVQLWCAVRSREQKCRRPIDFVSSGSHAIVVAKPGQCARICCSACRSKAHKQPTANVDSVDSLKPLTQLRRSGPPSHNTKIKEHKYKLTHAYGLCNVHQARTA